MSEHWKQALKEYAEDQGYTGNHERLDGNMVYTAEAMEWAVETLADRIAVDYDTWREMRNEEAHYQQINKEMERGL